MFHLFTGNIIHTADSVYIQNDVGGLEIQYLGSNTQGTVFLYPYIDDNKKTIIYYAFDTSQQKKLFTEITKINGIGAKTGFHIVQLPEEDLRTAVKELDVQFFKQIPGIGPKTAKKILLELQDSIDLKDIEKINMDEKLFKNIVNSLKNIGYPAEDIKGALRNYDGKVTKSNMATVIKKIIATLSE